MIRTILLLILALSLSGCITTGAQRTPITGGMELSAQQLGKLKGVKLNASGNTKVDILDDGSISITTEDGMGDLMEAYKTMRGK